MPRRRYAWSAGVLAGLLLAACATSRYFPTGTERAYLLYDLRGELVLLNGEVAFPIIRLERDFECTPADLARVTEPLRSDERVPHPLTADQSENAIVLAPKVNRIWLHRSEASSHVRRDQDLFVVRRDTLRSPVASAQNVVHFYNRLLACRDELQAPS